MSEIKNMSNETHEKMVGTYPGGRMRNIDGSVPCIAGTNNDKAKEIPRRLAACWNACEGIPTSWLAENKISDRWSEELKSQAPSSGDFVSGEKHKSVCAQRDILANKVAHYEQVLCVVPPEIIPLQYGGSANAISTERVTEVLRQRDALLAALESCAEALAFARDRLGMCGEGDGKDSKRDASDDIGSLPALIEAYAAIAACQPAAEPKDA